MGKKKLTQEYNRVKQPILDIIYVNFNILKRDGKGKFLVQPLVVLIVFGVTGLMTIYVIISA